VRKSGSPTLDLVLGGEKAREPIRVVAVERGEMSAELAVGLVDD